jgi:hypothetical protein
LKKNPKTKKNKKEEEEEDRPGIKRKKKTCKIQKQGKK